jgi:hypothetical protein
MSDLEEIRLLRARLATLEAEAAQPAGAKPVFREEDIADSTYFALHKKEILAAAPEGRIISRGATFGDALDTLRRTGSASGSAIDALRAAVEGPRTPATAPSRDQLAEAARVLTADLRGAPTIEEAFSDMQRRASRRDAIETAQAGASGRVDALDGPTSRAIDKLDKILKGR